MKKLIERINEEKRTVVIDSTAENFEDIDYDDFMADIKRADKEYESYIITGNLGLWDGKKEIYPEYVTSLVKAIEKCLDKCDDYIVYLNNGKLEVEGLHHDGRNTFMISAFSNKGQLRWEEYENGDTDDLEFLKKKDTFVDIKLW